LLAAQIWLHIAKQILLLQSALQQLKTRLLAELFTARLATLCARAFQKWELRCRIAHILVYEVDLSEIIILEVAYKLLCFIALH